jgi:threonyl-tRNA synthetase
MSEEIKESEIIEEVDESKQNSKKKDEKTHFEEKKPEFIEYRIKLVFLFNNKKFEELKKKRDEENLKNSKDITVEYQDKKFSAKSFVTKPIDIALQISEELAEKSIVARLNGEVVWDMGRILEEDCKIEFLDWEDKDAKEVFWHSSSHILGEALEQAYQILLCKGPPQKDGGFYYEGFMESK